MRINVRITLDDGDLTLEEIAHILMGGDTTVATIADDIEIVETVQEQIEIVEEYPPQTYFDGTHGCEEELEEEVEVVEETPEPETIEEEQEETQDEVATEPVTKKPEPEVKPRVRMIQPKRGLSRGRKRSHTSVSIPRRVQKTTKEPRRPTLENIKGAITTVRIGLLNENNINSVGEFLNADGEDLLRIMQMNWRQDTEVGLAKRTAYALIRSFEREWTEYQHSQIKKEAPEVKPGTPKQFEFNEKNLFMEVWNNIPARKAGVFTSFTIALDTINAIETGYENGCEVVHREVQRIADKVICAIYEHAKSAEYILGNSNTGYSYLVVLTKTKWPSRVEIESEYFEHDA